MEGQNDFILSDAERWRNHPVLQRDERDHVLKHWRT